MASIERSEALTGRVLRNGVAQTTTLVPGGVHVRLDVVPGAPGAPRQDGLYQSILLPDPVTVEAGQTMVLEVTWEGGGVQDFHMSQRSTITKALVQP